MPLTSAPTSTEEDGSTSNGNPTVLEFLPDGNEDYFDIYPCDVLLTVEEHKFPVHGSILACQSRVFSKTLGTLKENPGSKIDGKLPIKLADAVEDVKLMLSILYGSRIYLDTALEAARVMYLGDKYDIPKFFHLAEPTLCRLDDELHFTRELSSEKESSAADLLDVVPLLSIANRVGLKELRKHCQFVILKDTIAGIPEGLNPASSVLMRSMRALEKSGVNPRDTHEIAAYLIHSFAVGVQFRQIIQCKECKSTGFSSNSNSYCNRCGKYSLLCRFRVDLSNCKNAVLDGLSRFREWDEE